MHMVYTKTYDGPDFDRREILRYAGAASGPPEVLDLLEKCLEEVRGKLTYKVCFRSFSVYDRGEELDLEFARTASKDLRKNLAGCESIVLFGATVGMELDRLIARYSRLSPARALMLQAIGTERIEALAEQFQRELAQEQRAQGRYIRQRFSPGYGDLPLEMQRDVFRVLDCPRKIGLTLNESLLMSPSKSVTALIGIAETGECASPSAGCENCDQKNCTFRRQA